MGCQYVVVVYANQWEVMSMFTIFGSITSDRKMITIGLMLCTMIRRDGFGFNGDERAYYWHDVHEGKLKQAISAPTLESWIAAAAALPLVYMLLSCFCVTWFCVIGWHPPPPPYFYLVLIVLLRCLLTSWFNFSSFLSARVDRCRVSLRYTPDCCCFLVSLPAAQVKMLQKCMTISLKHFLFLNYLFISLF